MTFSLAAAPHSLLSIFVPRGESSARVSVNVGQCVLERHDIDVEAGKLGRLLRYQLGEGMS
jgi:hypothetical protein